MNLPEFADNYTHLSDDELLYLWADANTLVPEAATALDSEMQRRGLNKQNATRLKKRFQTLVARETKGPLANQVAAAKYERNMRHFVGWEEPQFVSPYGSRDIRTMFASMRHRYRVWVMFRNHTRHWPVYSILFYFISWSALFAFAASAFVWLVQRKQPRSLVVFAVAGCFLVLLGVRDLGARLMRKLDWKKYGAQHS